MLKPSALQVLTLVSLLLATLPAAAQVQSGPATSALKPEAMRAPNTFVAGRLITASLRAGEPGCSQPLSALSVEVVENFYVQSSDGLQIPRSRSPSGGGFTFDRLLAGNTALQQGRVLGGSQVAADGAFRVGWAEPLLMATATPKRPWIEGVQHVTATGTRIVTAYRVLELRLKVANPPPPPDALWATHFVPEPIVLYYGSETTKDVGVIRAVCTGFSF